MSLEKERIIEIKKEAKMLFESRYAMVQGDGAGAADGASLRYVNNRFNALAKEVGISGAALEFWLNPVGIQGELNAQSVCSEPLTRVERVMEQVNMELALEIKNAGLLEFI